MRILVMSDLYPPHIIGGSELSCESHAEGLRQRGHNVYVLTSWWGLDRASVEGNVYRLLNHAADSFPERRGSSLLGRWRLRRRFGDLKRALDWSANYKKTQMVLAAVRPEVVYAWHMQGVSINPLLAAQDHGIPGVLRLTDYWLAEMRADLCLEPSVLKRLYRTVLVGLGGFSRLDTSHMLPNSRALMLSYLRAGFPEDGMEVVPNGVPASLLVDVEQLRGLPLVDRGGEADLLFVGRLACEKGPDVAIRALSILVRELDVPRARLHIVGTGPREYETQLRDMARSLRLEGKVLFVGQLEHHLLLERYTQYDALLFTSRWPEPFSRVVIEAMARGLPVIATPCGGTAEVISDEENGLVVPPDDPMKLAEAIKRLIETPDLVRKLRYAGLKTLREHYDQDRLIAQVERYLEAVTSEAGSA